MSLTIRANQGNAIAADNAGIKKNESAEQIKKRNVVDARTLMIGNTTDEKINQKKNSVRNQAMKLIRDAWKSDNDSVDSRKEMEDARAQALEEARDYESKANDIEKQKKQLMEEYGIDPDSDEQKDLELLEKYQNNMSGASYDSFSDQEKERLKELQHTDFTDYQKKVLMLNSSRNSMTSVADQKKREALMYRQNLTDAKIDQLKSQDMLKAQDAADELNQAAADDAFNMLIEEGKDTIDNKTEEEKEKAEKAQVKKDEQDEKIQAAKDRKQIQEELVQKAAKNRIENEQPDTESQAAQNNRQRAQKDMIEGEIDSQMMDADASAQNKQVNNVEKAQTHINNIMKKNNLINEDLKGIEIDFNF